MRRAFLLLAALLVVASVAWAAQTIQGKIMSVDRHGKTLILLDGTKLMIPPSVKVQREDLKEGVTIRATFEQKKREERRDLYRGASGGAVGAVPITRQRRRSPEGYPGVRCCNGFSGNLFG